MLFVFSRNYWSPCALLPCWKTSRLSERKEKAASMAKLRCERIGCNAFFTEDDNPEGSCTYHELGPIFHDGMKEWSCCKKRSHDFGLFLEIPGCKTGTHTTKKPVLAKPAHQVKPSIRTSPTAASSNKDCSRCRQGFYCSDHAAPPNSKPTPTNSTADLQESCPAPEKKVAGINEPQTCKNKGCGGTFTEKNNHDTACSYHPGPAVFHDRVRGWKCCDIYVKEFDEFLGIPPCKKGWHNAGAS